MHCFRFHIGTLVVLVLVLGVGFAALRESNALWDGSIFSITLSVLLISILVAIQLAELRRTFWIGFSVFGWVYFGFSLVPSIESRLMTTKALTWLDSKVPGRSPADTINSGIGNKQVQNLVFGQRGNQLATTSQGQGWILDVATGNLLGGQGGTTENFVRIGHSLVALIVALVGGLLSRHLYAKNREAAQEQVILPQRSISKADSGR
jgi:hypothetical protein